jgi:hypothetical protein
MLASGCLHANSAPDTAAPASVAAVEAPAAPAPVTSVTHGKYLDVVALGAIGDGKADDTHAIQMAIDLAGKPDPASPGRTLPTAIFFPAGTYRVTRTLQFDPTRRVNCFEGSGFILPNGTSTAYTTLLWDGAVGGNMFDFKGYAGLKLCDLRLNGGGKAGILLRVNSVPGVGTAQFMLERLYLVRAAIGMELGADMDMCASDMTFIDVFFDHMTDCGFRALGLQQLNYIMYRCGVANSPKGFCFRRGGDSHFIQPSFFRVDTCFEIADVGINSGCFSIQGLFLERGAYTDNNKKMTIVKADGDATLSVDCIQTGCQMVWGDNADLTTPSFILGPSAQMSIQNSMLCGKIAKLTGAPNGAATFLTMDNCRFRCASDPRKDIEIDEHSGFELRNCNVAIDDTRAKDYQVKKNIFIRQFHRYGAKFNPPE